MKPLFLVIYFATSLSHAGFIKEMAGYYKSNPNLKNECEKDNVTVKCDSQIESMKIEIIDESKMRISVVVNDDPLHPLSVGCGHSDSSQGSTIDHSTVVETDEMIVCNWITNSAPYFPTTRRIEFKKITESVIEYKISNEYKGFVFGKFYNQNGVSSILERR